MEFDIIEDALFDDNWTRNWQVNRLVALVKEPGSIFAYWEISELRKKFIAEHFQTEWPALKLALQLYDVTDIYFNGYNAHSVRRMLVIPLSDNWYLNDLQPKRNYIVDLGVITERSFMAILRSNTVKTPPQRQYGKCEPLLRFGTVNQALEKERENEKPQVKVQDPKRTEINRSVAWSYKRKYWYKKFSGYSIAEQKGGAM